MHDAVLVPDGDTAFALRLTRSCARNPVALERLEYDASAPHVRSRFDKSDGPTAGTETVDPLEFLARVTAHIPNKHQVMMRYYEPAASRALIFRFPPCNSRTARPGSPAAVPALHRLPDSGRSTTDQAFLRAGMTIHRRPSSPMPAATGSATSAYTAEGSAIVSSPISATATNVPVAAF